MDFKKCEALLAAIDTGSFTKAAEQLHYTPSGISHMMTNLEAELGFPLLYRSKTGVVPTPSALELMPVLREMADCANRFEQISSRINGLQTGQSFCRILSRHPYHIKRRLPSGTGQLFGKQTGRYLPLQRKTRQPLYMDSPAERPYDCRTAAGTSHGRRKSIPSFRVSAGGLHHACLRCRL